MKLSTLSSLEQLHYLLKEKNPLLLVLHEMMDGVLICDASAKVLLFNQSLQQWLKLDDSVLDQPCAQAIPAEDFSLWVDSVLETGKPISEELILMCANLEKVFQLHVVPLTDPGSEATTGCVAVFHDITAIKKTEKMRRDFVANVSHELRTPLSAIKGYAETLLEGALEDKAVSRDFVSVIHNHSIRLSRLVEDLLDLSKLEASDFQPELRPVSLKPIVKRTLAMVAGNAGSKNITCTIGFEDDFPKVLANVSNLEQVFVNLLDNAVKYTPAQGRITVTARERGNMVEVSVTDTGIGIEPKHFPRLFERFYRVDKARSRDLGGTGLGLSIVKHIIQYHGGEIWVNSVPNQGCTFSFTLQKASAKGG